MTQLSNSELFQKLTEEKYHVEHHVSEAAIIIRSTKELPLTLKVTLTSPLIRDEAEKKDGGIERSSLVFLIVLMIFLLILCR